MWLDRVSKRGPLALESDAPPIALRLRNGRKVHVDENLEKKSNQPKSQPHDTISHSSCMSRLNTLACTVPE